MTPRKIVMPPPSPKKTESIPNATVSNSSPIVKGVNIPESNATAAMM